MHGDDYHSRDIDGISFSQAESATELENKKLDSVKIFANPFKTTKGNLPLCCFQATPHVRFSGFYEYTTVDVVICTNCHNTAGHVTGETTEIDS